MVKHQKKKQRTVGAGTDGATLSTPPPAVPPTPRRSARRSGTPAATQNTEEIQKKRKRLTVDSDGEESVASRNDANAKGGSQNTGGLKLLDTNASQGKEVEETGGGMFVPLLEYLKGSIGAKKSRLHSAATTLHTMIQQEDSNLSKFLDQVKMRENMTESVVGLVAAALAAAAENDATIAETSYSTMIVNFGKVLFELRTTLSENESLSNHNKAAKQFSDYVLDKVIAKASKETMKNVLEEMGLLEDKVKKIDIKKRLAVALLGPNAVEWIDDWIGVDDTKMALRQEKLEFLVDMVIPAITAPAVPPQSTRRLSELCTGSSFSAAAVALGGTIASAIKSVELLRREDPSFYGEVKAFLRRGVNMPVDLDSLGAMAATSSATPRAGCSLSRTFSRENLLQNDVVYRDLRDYIGKTKSEALADGATAEKKVAYSDWLREVENHMLENPLKEDTALGESELVGSGRLKFDKVQVIRHIASGGFGAVLDAIVTYKGQSFNVALKAELLSEGSEVADALRALETHGRVADLDNVATLLGYQFLKLDKSISRKKERKPAAIYCLLSLMELGYGTLKDEMGRGSRTKEERAKFGVGAGLDMMDMVTAFLTMKLVHRDIKSENLLYGFPEHMLDNQLKLKVCDFGISKPVMEDTRHSWAAGTDECRAPEVQSGAKVSIKSDVFSVGMIIFECVVGTAPLRVNDGSHNVNLESAERELRAAIDDEKKWKADLIKLILELIQNEPTNRPNPADACKRLNRVNQQFQ